MPKSVCWGFFQYSPYQGNHTYDMDYFYTIEDSNGNVTTNGTQSNPKTLQWIRPNNTFFDTGYHSAGTSNNNGNNNWVYRSLNAGDTMTFTGTFMTGNNTQNVYGVFAEWNSQNNKTIIP